MFSYLFNTFFYNPLYNGLVFLIDFMPSHDVGLAVIFLTIIVKLILFPLSYKAVKTQAALKIVQAEVDKVKEAMKDNKEELAKEIFAIYKKHNINPFAGFLTLLLQIPILFALYFIFLRGLPTINPELLYSFVSVPETVNMTLLGIFDVSEKSLIAALLVGVTQFIQARYAFSGMGSTTPAALGTSFKDDFMRGMQLQLKYVLPVIMTVVSYSLIAVVPIYWIVSNIFMTLQEIYLRKKGLKQGF